MEDKFLERIKNLDDEELKKLSDLDAQTTIQSNEWESIHLDLEQVKINRFETFKKLREHARK